VSSTAPEPAALVLDEMFSPTIAEALRARSHRVVAVVARIDLRAMTDDNLYAWVSSQRIWLMTENVKDFRPIMLRALQASTPTAGLLFTSSRTFPRSRQNPSPIIEAVHTWLTKAVPAHPTIEDWLVL
jgi:Domain of unknown function (DUF5615)